MKRSLRLHAARICIAVVALAAPLHAATLYVDVAASAGGDGSAGTPFATIAEGLAALQATNALEQGGHTLFIQPGRYPGGYTVSNELAGVDGATNVIAALPGTVTITNGNPAIRATPTVQPYFRVEGLRFESLPGYAFNLRGWFDSFTIRSCSICNGATHGIYYEGPAFRNNCVPVIEHCDFYGNSGSGIRAGYNNGFIIRNCSFVNNREYGFQRNDGYYSPMILENNLFYGNVAGLKRGGYPDNPLYLSAAALNAAQPILPAGYVPRAYTNNVDLAPLYVNAVSWDFTVLYAGSGLTNRATDGGHIGVCQNPVIIDPAATVYHVAPDGDDGRTPEQAANPDTPWRSLTNAARHAYAGVTVRAATGRYDGPVVVARSGTEAYPVVFEAEDGAPAAAVDAGGGAAAFVLTDVDRVVLSGFTCSNGATAGVLLTRANDCILTNLLCAGNAGAAAGTGDGVNAAYSSRIRLSGCRFRNNKGRGANLSYCSEVDFDCCRFDHNGTDGVRVGNSAAVRIAESDLFRNGARGLYLDYPPVVQRGSVLDHCVLAGNKTYGVEFTYQHDSWVFRDNLFAGNHTDAIYKYHFGPWLYLTNNLFYATGRFALRSYTGADKIAQYILPETIPPVVTNNVGERPNIQASGNRADDPLFADLASDWNFAALLPESPCRGAASDGAAIGHAAPAIAEPERRTFYVDAAAGDDDYTAVQAQARETPWQSLQRAADAARAGDTVALLPGVYTGQTVITNRGNSAAPVRFCAPEGGAAIAAAAYGIVLQDAVGVQIDGLLFTNRHTTAAIDVVQSYANVISNCWIQNSGTYGIRLSGYSPANRVTDCRIVSNATYGVSVATQYGNVIENSDVLLNNSYGLYIAGDANVVRGNRVFGNKNTYLGGASPTYNNLFVGNAPSIALAGTASFQNNLVASNTIAGLTVSGAAAVLNNIIIDCPRGIYATVATAGVSNNCFHGNATNLATYVGGVLTDYHTPGELNAYAKGSGNVVGDPQLWALEKGDYRLRRTSPCIDAGTQAGLWSYFPMEADALGGARVVPPGIDIGPVEMGRLGGTCVIVR